VCTYVYVQVYASVRVRCVCVCVYVHIHICKLFYTRVHIHIIHMCICMYMQFYIHVQHHQFFLSSLVRAHRSACVNRFARHGTRSVSTQVCPCNQITPNMFLFMCQSNHVLTRWCLILILLATSSDSQCFVVQHVDDALLDGTWCVHLFMFPCETRRENESVSCQQASRARSDTNVHAHADRRVDFSKIQLFCEGWRCLLHTCTRSAKRQNSERLGAWRR